MPRARFILLIGLAGLIALAGLVFTRNLIDFPVYYAAGRSLLGGRTDLYTPDFALGRVMDYRYPPVFLLAFWPLWLLPYKVAAYLWYLFGAAEIAGGVLLVRRAVGVANEQKSLWLVIFFATAPYFITILHYGNAHLLAICLLFAACYFVQTKKPIVGGLALALAISIKLTPAIFLPYFALRKQWRLLATVVMFLIGINLVPAFYFGFGKNSELLKDWFDHVVVNQEFHETNGPINLSLKGQLRRYFSTVDYEQRVDGDVRYPAVNLVSLPLPQIDLVWMSITILVCLFIFGLIVFARDKLRRRKGEERANAQGDRDAEYAESGRNRFKEIYPLEIALLICLMLLAEPLTSKIYFIALLWPVASLAAFAFNQSSRQARRMRVLLIGIAIVNSVLPLLPGRSLQRLLLVLGVDFYVNLLVLLALVYVILAIVRSVPSPSGGPQKRSLLATRTSSPLRHHQN